MNAAAPSARLEPLGFDPLDAPQPLELTASHTPKSRLALVQRLGEIACWPESRIPSYERQLAADILVGLLRTSGVEQRRRCAQGLAVLHDPPKGLLRYLARDEIQVAETLLENGVGFDELDLIATIRAGVAAHWMAIARRKTLGETVCDALIQTGEPSVIEAVLRNRGSKLSTFGVDMAVAKSRNAPHLASYLVSRIEMRPT